MTRSAQIHASLNSPQRIECATPPQKQGLPIRSDAPTATVSTPPSTHMSVNLALTAITLGTISQNLTTQSATHRCARVHIPHQVMPLITGHLVTLQGIIRSGTDEQLPHALIFHHFRLTVLSELILNDRTLDLTIDNAIYHLTSPRTTTVDPTHYLHLYLNPHDRLPYLQHTYTGTEPKSYRLIVTTSLPCHRPGSFSARCRPMLRTTSHAPDLVTTLTFPVASIQYQQSILTLTTHMLLTVPIITPRQS